MPEIIKIGTLAQKSTPWGKVFKVWVDNTRSKSSGRLELQFFYNGQQGDEDSMSRSTKVARDQGQHGVAVLLGALGRAGVLPQAVIDLGAALLLGPEATLQDISSLRGQRVGCFQDCAELAERLRALGAEVVTLVPGGPVPEGLVAIGGGALALGTLGRLRRGDTLLETELGRAGCGVIVLDEVLASRSAEDQAALRAALAEAGACEEVLAQNERALAALRRNYKAARPVAPAEVAPSVAVEETPAAQAAQPSAPVEEAAPAERGRGRRRGRGD